MNEEYRGGLIHHDDKKTQLYVMVRRGDVMVRRGGPSVRRYFDSKEEAKIYIDALLPYRFQ